MAETKKTGEKRRRRVWKIFLGVVLIVVDVMLLEVLFWAKRIFGDVPFAQVVYHINAPLDGTDSQIAEKYIFMVTSDLLVIAGVIYILFLPDVLRYFLKKVRKPESEEVINRDDLNNRRNKSFLEKTRRFLIKCIIPLAVVGMVVMLVVDIYSFGVIPWLKSQLQSSQLYEDYYVDPNQVQITAKGKTKNLILIVSESLEATYCKIEDGGASSYDLMPNLTRMAK